MTRYRGGLYLSRRSGAVGKEIALRHIRDAERLSRDLGGTDQDVKKYFFSLSSMQLNSIFNKYEAKYGKSARQYAERAYSSWKDGRVHMSGMVAERLFSLLPPIMPLEIKFQLTESLWRHIGPSSKKTFYVGLDASLDEVARSVRAHLEQVVVSYRIPASMEARFNWLSQGDVALKQQLLNYFRQNEKRLLFDSLRLQLPILINHLRSLEGVLTTHAAQVLNVGKHEVHIVVDERVSGVTDVAPPRKREASDYAWVWWLIVIGFLIWLFNK